MSNNIRISIQQRTLNALERFRASGEPAAPDVLIQRALRAAHGNTAARLKLEWLPDGEDGVRFALNKRLNKGAPLVTVHIARVYADRTHDIVEWKCRRVPTTSLRQMIRQHHLRAWRSAGIAVGIIGLDIQQVQSTALAAADNLGSRAI